MRRRDHKLGDKRPTASALVSPRFLRIPHLSSLSVYAPQVKPTQREPSRLNTLIMGNRRLVLAATRRLIEGKKKEPGSSGFFPFFFFSASQTFHCVTRRTQQQRKKRKKRQPCRKSGGGGLFWLACHRLRGPRERLGERGARRGYRPRSQRDAKRDAAVDGWWESIRTRSFGIDPAAH